MPLLEDHQPDVYPASPMALVGVFVAIMQERFSGSNEEGLPWYWDPDPTPRIDEEGDERSPRKIYIASQFSEFPEGRDVLPAILVDKDDTVFLKQWFGHRAHTDTKTRTDVFLAHAQVPISILCNAENRGESALLGDVVAMHILSGTNAMRETFGFHEVTSPILGKTQVMRRSSAQIESWTTPVNFMVQAKFMWRTQPFAPVLSQIVTRITASGDGDFTDGAIDLSLYNGGSK